MCLTEDHRREWSVYNVVLEMELQMQLRLQLYEIGRQQLERLQPDYGQSRHRGLVALCG